MKILTPAEIYELLPDRLNTLAEARGFTVGFELCQEMARSEPYEARKAEFCRSCAYPDRADALGAQVLEQAARIKELEQDSDFTKQWYAVRIKRIRDLLRGTELWTEYNCIMANGVANSSEPPRYGQLMNILRHNYEEEQKKNAAARHRIAELETAVAAAEERGARAAKDIEYMDHECRTCISAAFCGRQEANNGRPCDAYSPLPRVKNIESRLKERDVRIAALESKSAAARAENERLAGNRDLLVDEATDMQADIEGYLKELAALRAQRDAAIRERDDARWELCEDLAAWAQEFNNISPDPSVHAAARGWSYLYDKDGGR